MMVGKAIRAARKDLHWSQEQLAIRLGVAYKTLQDWEYGRRKPTPINRVKIRLVLGVDVDEMLDSKRQHSKLAQELLEHRQLLDFSQEQMARSLGMTRTLYQYFESGEREIPPHQELKMKQFFSFLNRKEIKP